MENNREKLHFIDEMIKFALQAFIHNPEVKKGCVRRGHKLFRGHRELMVEWNKNLPFEKKIRLDQYEHDVNPGSSSELPEPLATTLEKTPNSPTAYSQDEQFKKALSFMHEVKCEFINQPRLVRDFLKTLKEYSRSRINLSEVQRRVTNLFRGHPNLIVLWNKYNENDEEMQFCDSSSLGSTGATLTPLQTIQRTSTNPPTASSQEEMDTTLSFIAQVKHNFINQTAIVTDFINALKEFRSGCIDQSKVVQRVPLFRSRELYAPWNKYLNPEDRFDPDRHQAIVRNNFSPYESTDISIKPLVQTTSQELDKVETYIAQVKHEFLKHTEVVRDFINTLKEFQYGRIDLNEVVQRVSHFFRGHRELIGHWNKYLPPEERFDPDQLENASNPGSSLESTETPLQPLVPTLQTTSQELLDEAQSYIAQVKSKLKNQPEVLDEFLDLTTQLYPASEKTPEILQRVSDLLRGHPELIFGYNQFLPPCYKIKV